MTEAPATQATVRQVYVTLHGLPLTMDFAWPFHLSQTGADFYILHSTARLENGGALHALVALQLTLTVKEVLPSLEPHDVEWAAINTIRKAVDTKDIEFLKTPKRVPVQFNSRAWDFKRNRWAFGQASDLQVAQLIERKVYWQSKLQGSGARVWIADPVDAQYVDTPAARMAEIAHSLMERGLLRIEGDYATASEKLLAQAERIEGDMKRGQDDLEQKHAYERG
jgi:hypothetical protein